ncbi:hypothetical protein N473_04850 [Pseudoalteromonas luteoviolacea CPMOR-1]|uniref:Uncharacterized protein n=1 Tax=Pseudoalteromonas luteoviolacea CPMOR-1 TaxID=1365248 RepID=A0A167HFS3_9GAMM|nr:hypothetical protein [Pseudoalteromonas luteoviolacea]KZN58071.1 hypothetical protein N473_04850 [Pseudoalteromonas luteoviolacea CPMOR-1]
MKVKKKNLKVLSNSAASYVNAGGTGGHSSRQPPQAMRIQPLVFVPNN